MNDNKQGGEILDAEHEKLMNILDNLRQGVSIISEKGIVEYANPVVEREFGAYTGRKCHEYFRVDPKDCRWCDFSKIKKGKAACWERAGKDNRVYEVIDIPIITEDKKLAKLNVMTDVTDVKEAQEVLRRDKMALQKLVGEKADELTKAHRDLEREKRLADIGRLSAIVAHELRSPLGAIKAAIFNLRRKKGKFIRGKQIQNIENKINESAQIIENLLSYSKIQNTQFKPVNIASVIDKCIFDLEREYPKAITTAGKMKPVRRLDIDADPLQIKEIFGNLLDNALCAASAVRKGKVTLSGKVLKGEILVISIKDNGPGIEDKDKPKIFEPFYTRKTKGVGLGLTIASELIHLHNGNINVASRSGKGTTVTVSLPISHR